jgi:hypothetical protein
LATELTLAIEELEWDEETINPYDLAQKWTMHNDARSYVVIGDPAVQSPIALPGETPATERPDLGTISLPARSPALEPEPETAAAPPETTAEVPMDAESFAVAFGLRDQFNDLTGSVRRFTDQLATALRDAAADLTTLEVKTYTTSDLDTLAESKLRARTFVEFDGDIEIYVPERTGGIDEEIRQIHLEMVRDAQANRAQFLSAMAEMATNLLKSLK